jgi:hypothetical protein
MIPRRWHRLLFSNAGPAASSTKIEAADERNLDMATLKDEIKDHPPLQVNTIAIIIASLALILSLIAAARGRAGGPVAGLGEGGSLARAVKSGVLGWLWRLSSIHTHRSEGI